MRIKKFLEKAAEEDWESLINDRDIEFLASIGVDYNKKREAAQNEPDSSYYRTAPAFNYKAFAISLACFIVAAIAVTLILYFSLKPAPVDSPIHYFEDNFVEVDSDLAELNNNLKLFSLKLNENVFDVDITKTFDELSGDNLFFALTFTTKQQPAKSFKLEIVVNSNYEYEGLAYSIEPVETQISDYNLKYTEITDAKGPLITASCMGEMKIGDQWIYITEYNETAIGKSTFIETLEAIIQFK